MWNKLTIAVTALWLQTGVTADYRLKPSEVEAIPHDANHFTQGLLIHNNTVVETTGLYGQSRFYTYRAGQAPEAKLALNPQLFGEGLAYFQKHFFWLSWRAGLAWQISAKDFSLVNTFNYEGEGWGLTSNEHHLIMSNGSDQITFRNPDSFAVERRLAVTRNKQPIVKINELEWVNGFIYANIWQKDEIVKIDPKSGHVLATISAKPLRNHFNVPSNDVLNGIAYDKHTEKFLITGKNWPVALWVDLP